MRTALIIFVSNWQTTYLLQSFLNKYFIFIKNNLHFSYNLIIFIVILWIYSLKVSNGVWLLFYLPTKYTTMTCTSGSVEKVSKNHTNAAEQIKKLEAALQANQTTYKNEFFAQIAQSLASAKITDARQLEYAENMKTEYTSEFSLDKIAAVVVAALNAVVAAKDPTSPTPGMDKEAIEAYTAVVNTVAEAAKSSSQSSSSLAYSMSRLCPGIYAFLQAKSTSILDEDTFGSEAVSVTSIFYRVMQSIDDIKNEAKFGLAVLDAQNLIDMKKLQLGLTKRLTDGEIDIDTWIKLDGKYEGIIQELKDRLAEHGWEEPNHEKLAENNLNEAIIEAMTGIEKLKGMSSRHMNIAKLIETRINSGYHFKVI